MIASSSSRRITLLGISGSLRRGSFNTALLHEFGRRLSQNVIMTVGEIGDLPLYNRDVELVGLPAPVVRLRGQMAAADGLVIACPEYNFSVTGALKNAIDWASRKPDSPLDHMPTAILGGGGRRSGSRRAQGHLREILSHNEANVLAAPEVVVMRVREAFDENLVLVDTATSAAIDDLVVAFEDFVSDAVAG